MIGCCSAAFTSAARKNQPMERVMQSHVITQTASFNLGVFAILKTWFAAAYRHHVRAGIIRELRAQDDRILDDLGISRADIPAAVDGRLAR
jgi:uncharacterized protein YjiS (DUF1127 family)